MRTPAFTDGPARSGLRRNAQVTSVARRHPLHRTPEPPRASSRCSLSRSPAPSSMAPLENNPSTWPAISFIDELIAEIAQRGGVRIIRGCLLRVRAAFLTGGGDRAAVASAHAGRGAAPSRPPSKIWSILARPRRRSMTSAPSMRPPGRQVKGITMHRYAAGKDRYCPTPPETATGAGRHEFKQPKGPLLRVL